MPAAPRMFTAASRDASTNSSASFCSRRSPVRCDEPAIRATRPEAAHPAVNDFDHLPFPFETPRSDVSPAPQQPPGRFLKLEQAFCFGEMYPPAVVSECFSQQLVFFATATRSKMWSCA